MTFSNMNPAVNDTIKVNDIMVGVFIQSPCNFFANQWQNLVKLSLYSSFIETPTVFQFPLLLYPLGLSTNLIP